MATLRDLFIQKQIHEDELERLLIDYNLNAGYNDEERQVAIDEQHDIVKRYQAEYAQRLATHSVGELLNPPPHHNTHALFDEAVLHIRALMRTQDEGQANLSLRQMYNLEKNFREWLEYAATNPYHANRAINSALVEEHIARLQRPIADRQNVILSMLQDPRYSAMEPSLQQTLLYEEGS